MRASLFVLSSLLLGAPAHAIVGPTSEDSPLRRHIVMLLSHNGPAQAYCSGAVIARNIVLTAAHCVRTPHETAVLVRDPKGNDALRRVAAVAVHPEFHADAIRTRRRSIDIALVRLLDPLPDSVTPAPLASSADIAEGDRFRLAGFGLTREGVERTAGSFSWGVVAARDPLSKVLLWAEDPDHRGLGACTGDSGGPIFDEHDNSIVAVIDWTTGEHGRHCGALTQGAFVAPQRGWIDGVLRAWGAR